MDYTVHGILQARILEWVAFPFSRGSSQSRYLSQVSRIADKFFTSGEPRGHAQFFRSLKELGTQKVHKPSFIPHVLIKKVPSQVYSEENWNQEKQSKLSKVIQVMKTHNQLGTFWLTDRSAYSADSLTFEYEIRMQFIFIFLIVTCF